MIAIGTPSAERLGPTTIWFDPRSAGSPEPLRLRSPRIWPTGQA